MKTLMANMTLLMATLMTMTLLTDATVVTVATVVKIVVATETLSLLTALSINIMATGRADRIETTTTTQQQRHQQQRQQVDTLPTTAWSTATKAKEATWGALNMEKICIDISW